MRPRATRSVSEFLLHLTILIPLPRLARVLLWYYSEPLARLSNSQVLRTPAVLPDEMAKRLDSLLAIPFHAIVTTNFNGPRHVNALSYAFLV